MPNTLLSLLLLEAIVVRTVLAILTNRILALTGRRPDRDGRDVGIRILKCMQLARVPVGAFQLFSRLTRKAS